MDTFASLDALPPPPAMPEWSPVRRFGGYAAWGDRGRDGVHGKQFDASCACANTCGVLALSARLGREEREILRACDGLRATLDGKLVVDVVQVRLYGLRRDA
jgi:hypothetical protein